MRRNKKLVASLVLGLFLALGSGGVVSALQSSSANYGIDETFFGSGGNLDDTCSATYCAHQSLGDTAVGSASSANYSLQAGSENTRDTSLEMVVNTTNVNIGQLTSISTKVGSATFSVKSYLSSGYYVYTRSPGPKNGSHILSLLTGSTTSTTGTEQFGLNLVANACPPNTPTTGAGSCTGGYGADPAQAPDSSFGFGQAQAGYDLADHYKYNDNDIIAYSNRSSGETDYTISYLFNISDVTPGGTYTMAQSLVATATF